MAKAFTARLLCTHWPIQTMKRDSCWHLGPVAVLQDEYHKANILSFWILSSPEDICIPGAGSWQLAVFRTICSGCVAIACFYDCLWLLKGSSTSWISLSGHRKTGRNPNRAKNLDYWLLLSLACLNQGRREAGSWSFSECGTWQRRMHTILQIPLWPVSEHLRTHWYKGFEMPRPPKLVILPTSVQNSIASDIRTHQDASGIIRRPGVCAC